MKADHRAMQLSRLHDKAAESRQRVIESQLSLAFTLCAIAETEIRYDRPDQAMKILQKLASHTETLRIHLVEPNHLPKSAISDLCKQLTKLKERTKEVESRLHPR
jgi:hypothetical protein